MTDPRRSPLQLAALASASVKGLDPVSVEPVHGDDERCDVAYVQDSKGRRWTIRVPRSVADAAQMEAAAVLLPLIDHRLPFTVPTEAGSVPLRDNGRAMVFPQVEGRHLDFSLLPPGPGLAVEVGRALAAVHNLDARVFDEAGVPAYDAEACRRRHLAEVDRAASTGSVPARLLGRWERALERVTHWRFAEVPVHGRMSGELVLAGFDADDDASTGRVVSITGWDQARVGDPADDFATLWAQTSEEVWDTVMEAYAAARHERPDRGLEIRAQLLSELHLVRELVQARTAGDKRGVARATQALRELDEDVAGEELGADEPQATSPGAASPATTPGSAAPSDPPLDTASPAPTERRARDSGDAPADEDPTDQQDTDWAPDDRDEYVVDTTTRTTTHLSDGPRHS